MLAFNFKMLYKQQSCVTIVITEGALSMGIIWFITWENWQAKKIRIKINFDINSLILITSLATSESQQLTLAS